MDNEQKSVLRWLIGLPIRLVLALLLTGILAGMPFQFRSVAAEVLPKLLLLVLLAGYTWAVYFELPFCRKHRRWQRIFISSVVACVLLLLTGLVAGLVVNAVLSGKSDRRVEVVTLSSGEVLENHTYYESGFRFNELYLKNPATGTSERVDAYRGFNYEAGPNDSSLLQQYPHPQEFVYGDKKALVIGPYVCKRWNWKKGPYWYIARFDMAGWDAANYLKSFVKPNSAWFSSPGSGPEHYQIENLDLENNVLTVKRVPWNAQTEPPEFRDFPDYLVYSASGYNDKSGYEFQWEFDEARTRAKNGALWEKPMPFRMALDYSVITFPAKSGFTPHGEKRDAALAHDGAVEIAATSLELSDQQVREAECKYVNRTNAITDKIAAMYGHACAGTNQFYIVWEPRDPQVWHSAATLNLDEWTLVGEGFFGRNMPRDEYIRLRKIEP